MRLAANKPDSPFDGFRVIFSGDFGQCPPVNSGAPFHAHALFQGLEMFVLTQSFRVIDPQSLSMCSNMRYNKVTLVRSTCTGHDQPAKALEFDQNLDLPHLVTTTNKEVNALNFEYIQTFAQAKESKIFNIPMPNKSMKMSSA